MTSPLTLVLVRSRRWLVEDVSTPNGERSAIVRLSCADDDSAGAGSGRCWHYEPDRLIVEDEGWADLASRGFDPPRTFA